MSGQELNPEPKQKTNAEKRTDGIILQEQQAEQDRFYSEQIHQNRLEKEQQIIAAALEKTKLEEAKKNSQDAIRQIKETLSKQEQQYLENQADFIKQTKLFEKQILEKTDDAKIMHYEARIIHTEAKQITHEKNSEFKYSDDLFRKSPMPTSSQITHMEKNSGLLSDFDREAVERIQSSKNQLKLQTADNIKKADLAYEKKKFDERQAAEQKNKRTVEYLEKVLGITAIKEYEHIKEIKQKTKSIVLTKQKN